MIAPCSNVLWENLYMREVLIIKVELSTTLSNFTPLDLKIVPLLSHLAVNNLGLKQM